MDKSGSTHLVVPQPAALKFGGLDAIFTPRTVAVIDGSEKESDITRTVLSNLVNHPFGGTVFPVSRRETHVLGIKSYAKVSDAPEAVDLAVVAAPAQEVPGVIGECADAGVRGAIILSPGFRETGAEGAELESQVLEQARRGQMRIIGPNCLGVMNTATRLNATFAHAMARRGNVAFISQSGALCAAVLDWSLREHVGFSAFVSVGSMLDVGWGDLIYYLSDDPHTRSIILYMESVGDARAFLSAAREVSLSKPIIVLKAGRTEGAAKAAASHTGVLTGSDEVYTAAFRRCGAVRVNSLSDLFYMAEVFAKQPRPLGPKLTILTNAGGPAVLAVDALLAGGGELAPLSDETVHGLDQMLPPHWSHRNPVDLLDDATPERYARALEILGRDSSAHGFLVILTPQALTDPTETAEALKPFSQRFGKPVLASWMGGTQAQAGENILNHANIPTFAYPDTAARMFDYMWRYTYNLRGIYETPILPSNGDGAPDRGGVDKIIRTARESGRTILSEVESKQILEAYHIPIVHTRFAKSEQEAVSTADEIGYPVVLKIHSYTVTHKSDLGGVKLNLCDSDAVRIAYREMASSLRAQEAGNRAQNFEVTVQRMVQGSGYELIVGSSVDEQFGPVLLFGAGGRQAEMFRDRALGLPPLNSTLARRMMEQTRTYRALQKVNDRTPINLASLEEVLVHFSQLVVEQRWIKEIDINPLFIHTAPNHLQLGESEKGCIALDSRMILYGPETGEESLPKVAIRPYPVQYVEPWTTKDGVPLLIRPIRPEDEPLMIDFHTKLSDRSVYFRYMHALQLSQRIAHERLARICFNDYDRELALVAERESQDAGGVAKREILGVGRLSKMHGRNEAEFAVIVADAFQGHGLGTELLRRLLQVGRDEGLSRIIGFIASDNMSMQRVSERLGFRLRRSYEDQEVEAVIDLS